MKRKAVALVSGGLDSTLAVEIIKRQGIEIKTLNFNIGFCGSCGIDVIDEYKNVLLHPQHGYGANLNPCLDCKIFIVKKAKQWLDEHNFDFIITGEVVGQRPKSQRVDTMPIVARESGAHDLLLRPLCAKLLPLTLPEREGWVDRELLYGFSGRSRKPQIALAQQFDITDYQQPAGGCLLTDKKFCDRLADLWEHNNKDYNRDDLELLKIGRHLRIDDTKLIIGRNEAENNILEKHINKYITMRTISHGGPVALIMGKNHSQEQFARIIARFSGGRDADEVEIQITDTDGSITKLAVNPLAPDEIKKEWYI